jgi:hypoxanthine phosphoribosyltransferase
MQRDIERVLIDRHAIAKRIDEVATQISRDYADPAHPDGERLELTLIPILTGSIIFVSDLIRRMPHRMKIRLISVSSYPGATTTAKGIRLRDELTNLAGNLDGAHVLLVDDILDSGGTLRMVTGLLRERRPASLRTAVLLRKDRPEARAFPVDYVCFDIPDDFVVGYGLDYNDYYRNLPDVVTLRREVTANP